MKARDRIAIAVAVLLFVVWAVLAALKLTEVQPIVDFIKVTLVGLATHYLHQTSKGDSP